jgi:hypothetical protein
MTLYELVYLYVAMFGPCICFYYQPCFSFYVWTMYQ